MNTFNYVTRNEICVNTFEEAGKLADILMNNGYVVMLSREEKLYVVNYIWAEHSYADRNAVVFQDRDTVEEYFFHPEGEDD